ncbi:MAG: ATP-binding protein [Planctomycetaceae bacterium]|jgi:predicted ATP-dependent endonuclease of OLD family|nr:ATP-binding protein [Planctomycetaceae bacterium]
MFFELKNIGKIEQARLELRGITVLAGKNSTGKSTFGKALFCMFAAFFDSARTIRTERKKSIFELIQLSSRHLRSGASIDVDILSKKISDADSVEKLRAIVDGLTAKQHGAGVDKDVADILKSQLETYIAISDEQMQRDLLTRYLKAVFDGQVLHVNKPNTTGEISLTIREKQLQAIIKGSECVSYIDDVGVMHKAFYIDTPFILDKINQYNQLPYPKYSHQGLLIKYLRRNEDENGIIEAAVAKQKLDNILTHINSVVCGDFKKTEQGWGFQLCDLEYPLSFTDVSAGMKPFLIIKRLLEVGELKEQDVLILDEPEIHLHPKWQIEFAKLLVLLQKEFKLTILLTTHSPYFLDALEVYSADQGIADNCNYYLTTNGDEYCCAEDVTKHTGSIYKLLAEPLDQLEEKRCD